MNVMFFHVHPKQKKTNNNLRNLNSDNRAGQLLLLPNDVNINIEYTEVDLVLFFSIDSILIRNNFGQRLFVVVNITYTRTYIHTVSSSL